MKKQLKRVGKNKAVTQQKKPTVHYSTNEKTNTPTDTVVADSQSNRRVIEYSLTEVKLKNTNFMFALDEIRVGIRKEKYTTINQCKKQENFAYCSKEDQEQLILIANWYLWETQP